MHKIKIQTRLFRISQEQEPLEGHYHFRIFDSIYTSPKLSMYGELVSLTKGTSILLNTRLWEALELKLPKGNKITTCISFLFAKRSEAENLYDVCGNYIRRVSLLKPSKFKRVSMTDSRHII